MNLCGIVYALTNKADAMNAQSSTLNHTYAELCVLPSHAYVCVDVAEKYSDNDGAYEVYTMLAGDALYTVSSMYGPNEFQNQRKVFANATLAQTVRATELYVAACHTGGLCPYLGCIVELKGSRKAPNRTPLLVENFEAAGYDARYNQHVTAKVYVGGVWVSASCINRVISGKSPSWGITKAEADVIRAGMVAGDYWSNLEPKQVCSANSKDSVNDCAIVDTQTNPQGSPMDTQTTELRNKLAAINTAALGSMLTELVTRNGQTVLKCYTLNRANAEAIAEGGLILELYDGYLIIPAPPLKV